MVSSTQTSVRPPIRIAIPAPLSSLTPPPPVRAPTKPVSAAGRGNRRVGDGHAGAHAADMRGDRPKREAPRLRGRAARRQHEDTAGGREGDACKALKGTSLAADASAVLLQRRQADDRQAAGVDNEGAGVRTTWATAEESYRVYVW